MSPLRLTITAVLLSGALGLSAQQISLKVTETDQRGPKHELLQCPGGDYLAVTYHFEGDKDPAAITRWNPKTLEQRWTAEVQGLAEQNYRAAMYSDGRLFVLCSNKDGAVTRYEIDDKKGTLQGSGSSLFSLEGKVENAKFFSGSSANKNFHYMAAKETIRKQDGITLDGVILDKQMNRIASFSYTTPEDKDDFKHLDIVQGDNGILYLIYCIGVKAKKDDYSPNVYTICQVDTKGKTSAAQITGLPTGDLRNLSWTPENNQLSFTGFISVEKKEGFTSFVSGSYDPAAKKVSGIHQTEIKSLLTQPTDIIKDIEKKGLPSEVTVMKKVPLSDGSSMLVLEVNSDRFYQSYYAPAAGPARYTPGGTRIGMAPNTPSYSMTYQNRGNLYLIKLDKSGTPKWLNLVSKKQQEGDMVISIGTACIKDDKDNIHLFFYDSKKNEEPASAAPTQITGTDKKNSFVCVTVTPDGKMKKQFIELQDPEYRLMIEKESYTEATGELFFMTIKTKMAFSAERLFNHANFRLGRLEVK